MPPFAKKTAPNHPFRRLLLACAAVAGLFAVAGATYQCISVARDRRAHPMPGKLVEVNGRKMHIDCEGAGSPTVVLDSGLGDSFVSWQKVQPKMAAFTRVCSYDRLGMGYSESTLGSRTSRQIVEELHTLLRNAEIDPPFVLVGHSMAGYDVRIFASLYRSEVAGMVLVDASHPEQMKRFPPELNDMTATWLREQEFLAAIMPFGIPRLLGFCASNADTRAAECNFHSEVAATRELKAFSESAAQAAATGTLGDLPLAVLSEDPAMPQADLPEDLAKPTRDAWSQMQNELAQLSTDSTHEIAKGSGHYVQLDRPEMVVAAVKTVVEKARARAVVVAH